MTRPRTARLVPVAGIAGAALVSLLWPAGLFARGAQAVLPQPGPAPRRLVVQANRSMVLSVPYDITLYSFTDPDVADGLTVGARELLINGKKPGTISLMVFGSTARDHYELVVDETTPTLQQRLQVLFPGEDIRVTTVGKAFVLTGRVSSAAVVERAGDIASKSALETNVVNLLESSGGAQAVPGLQQRLQTLFPGEDIQVSSAGKALILSGHVSTSVIKDQAAEVALKSVPESTVVNLLLPRSAPPPPAGLQVMLQVRFAEVSHKALTEVGSTLAATNNGTNTTSNLQLGDAGGGNDFLNLLFFKGGLNIDVVIKALQTSGTFESLAEPNLIAFNGQPASFLAGGEIPVPIVSIGGTTIEWKPFGVGLKFTPTITGDVIHLKVNPEVSALDFSNAVVLPGGSRIPALTKRSAETEVELRDGQSFAIAGLLDRIGQDNKAAVPGLSSIPIIGQLFRSKSKTAERTELLVLITVRLVTPLNADQVPPLPKIIKKESRRP